MEALIVFIVDKVVGCTCGVAAGRLGDYSKRVTDLDSKLKELARATGTLQGRVDQAKLDGHNIKEEVQSFLSKAARISEQATMFLQTECQTANVKCFVGSFPNLISRRQLSKRAKEMIHGLSGAVEIVAGYGFHTVISRPALHSCVADRDGFADFGTRELTQKEVMAALSSDNVTKIGLYGMGGVGKTMLAKEVARQAAEKKMFSEVVFVTLSQTPDLIAIQGSVAEKIHLFLGGIKSKAERADRLKRRLKLENKILIILDDIWEALDLAEVGLNFDPDQKGCKILMTSRNLNVTRTLMHAEKNIVVDVLDSNEATTLFTAIVGKNKVEHSLFNDLAIDVINECKGLPLALKTVANALKNKMQNDWKDALLQLKKSAPNNIDGMLTRVYPSIRLSFEYLESTEAKKLLLLCGLYEEDWNIKLEELAMLCMGWGIFQGVDSIGDATRRVWSLVGTLKDRCLLLDGVDDKHVKLHDVTRDVAMFIASEDPWDMHSVSIDDRLEDKLHKNNFKEAKAISLHGYHNFKSLPSTKLECPRLELFVISSQTLHSYECFEIRKDFLQECLNLKALSLFKVDLVHSSLIHSLRNIVTLRLYHCDLDDIDYIGDLKTLIVLDLRHSNVMQLPSRIGQLSRLQVLNLEGCYQLEVISANVLSRLTELEELHIPNSFQNWEAGEVGEERINASVSELMNLHKLTTLSLNIRDTNILPKVLVLSQNLETYNISFGFRRRSKTDLMMKAQFREDCQNSNLFFEGQYSNLNYSKMLEITDFKENDLGSLMRSSEYISLEGPMGDLKSRVVSDMEQQGFPELKTIEIEGCDDVKYIIHDTDQKNNVKLFNSVFVRLEIMTLCRLRNLEMICDGKLRASLFGQLTKVNVSSCGRLKNLFPASIARRLLNVAVGSCKSMEEIVTFDGESDNAATAPFRSQLRTLRLDSLPMLVQFISQPLCGVTCSVETSASPLCNEKVMLQSTSQNFELEERTLSSKTHSFPHLRKLYLGSLPKLKTFCATSKEQVVPFGEQEPLFNETVALPKLQYLELCDIGVQKLWTDELLSTSNNCMQNSILEYLDIQECDNLRSLSSISEKPATLKDLFVQDCKNLDNIFFHQGRDEEGTSSLGTLSFPDLASLTLINLPKLKNFCATSNEQVLQSGEQELLFSEMVALPNLKRLTLHKIDAQKIGTAGLLSTSNNSMQNSILEYLSVQECDNLKCLSSISDKPTTLQNLFAINCKSLEVIFHHQAGNEEGTSSLETLSFPCLKVLELCYLPKLKKFCATTHEQVLQLGEQESLFNEMVALPNLRRLTLCKIDAQKIETAGLLSTSNNSMQNSILEYLSVQECDNLKYLLLISDKPTTLQNLFAINCKSLEVIFHHQAGNEEGTSSLETLSFPHLVQLRLNDLPNLKTFSATINEQVIQFDEQETLFNKTVFPKLKYLNLSRLNIESLFPDCDPMLLPTTLLSMGNLTYLEVMECNKLKYLFSYAISERLVNLKTLEVFDCSELEGVVATKEDHQIVVSEVIIFPKLDSLTLVNLPALVSLFLGSDERVRFSNTIDHQKIENCPKLNEFSDEFCRSTNEDIKTMLE